MKKSCLRPQSEQVIIALFKAGAILIRYGGKVKHELSVEHKQKG